MLQIWRKLEADEAHVAIWLPYSEFPHVKEGPREGIWAWWIRGSIPLAIAEFPAFDLEAVTTLNKTAGWKLKLRSRKGSSRSVMQELGRKNYRYWSDVPMIAIENLEIVGDISPGLFNPLKHIHLDSTRYLIGPPRITDLWTEELSGAVPW